MTDSAALLPSRLMSCVKDDVDAEQQTQELLGRQQSVFRAAKVPLSHLACELYVAAGFKWPRDCDDALIAVLICRDLREQNGCAEFCV